MSRERDFYGGVPRDVDKMVSIKIDNLSSRTRVEDLKYMFEKYGRVGDVYIPRNRSTGKSKGFAFVRYYKTRYGDRAIRDMDGRRLNGSVVTVTWAKHERHEIKPNRGGRSRSRTRSRSRSPVYKSRRNYHKSESRSRSRSRSPRSESFSDRNESEKLSDRNQERHASPRSSHEATNVASQADGLAELHD